MNVILAQGMGIIATVIILYIVHLKNIKKILIGEIAVNLAVALNYILLEGFSGAGLCIIATAHTLVSYYFSKTEKKFPKACMTVFILLYILWTASTYKSMLDILPGISSLLFAFAIMQEQPSRYRILKTLNSFVWIIYDVKIMAYTTVLTHLFLFISSIIAIIRIDVRKK